MVYAHRQMATGGEITEETNMIKHIGSNVTVSSSVNVIAVQTPRNAVYLDSYNTVYLDKESALQLVKFINEVFPEEKKEHGNSYP